MADGKNFKCVDSFDKFFERDSFGSFIPKPGNLLMEQAQERFNRQLRAKTGFYDRLAAIYNRTDVDFTDNPLGNTPVVGVGLKMIGKRPLNVKSGRRMERLKGSGQNLTNQLANRQKKIVAIHNELKSVLENIKPTIKTPGEQLLYDVEGDQVMTGGGFDNNRIGGVHESALNFVINSSESIDYADSVLSEIVVEGSLWLRDLLKSYGLREGELTPMGATQVRAEQDNDGMFGYPVYASGNTALDADLAKRLVIETGVDVSKFVGTSVVDTNTHNTYEFRVIDAAAYILDSKVFTYEELLSFVTLLARIQKHGWKSGQDGDVAKDGKTRSVYPNAFIPAVVEAMIFTPFNDKLKELKAPIMPSLQDKPTRVAMLKKQITEAINNKYDYLAADWSKYDSSVKGAILATMIQLAVKPFFNAKYYYWVDVATYILTYKYLITDTNLCKLNADMYDQAKQSASNFQAKNYTIFGLVDGLISGAKFTHVGGSLYGEVVIHYGIGRLLKWEPIPGAQAGDDTLMGIPVDRIVPADVHKTYDPIEEAASKFGLKMNVSKQIWHQQNGEIVKVFLQDSYHYSTDIWGVGSIFRPADAVWYSERDKGLSVPEQLMAEIARMNQGADSPFVQPVVEWWLSKERYLGWMFKEYGSNAFSKLVESIGKSVSEIAKSIEVGSFSFGVSKDDMQAGTLPILPVMATVAAKMDFSSGDKAKFLADLDGIEDDGSTELTLNPELDDDDSIE